MPVPKIKGQRLIKVNALTQAQLIKLLLEGTYTCRELAEMTGLHYVTVLHYTRELYKAGAAHICMWEKDSRDRDALKIYKLGEGRDARRRKLTRNERQQRHRSKVKNAALVNSLSIVDRAA